MLGKIFRFFFWGSLYPVSETWDLIVRDRMERFEFEIINQYEAKLGDLTLWIANYPYAYLSDRNCSHLELFIPKKETRYEAKKRIDKAFRSYLINKYVVK